MGRLFVRVAVVTLFAVLGIAAQVRTKPNAGAAAKPAASSAEYEISTVLLSGGLFLVHINSAPDFEGSPDDAFKAFFQDHFGTRPRDPNRALPKIVIEFGDDDKIAEMINAVNTVRVLPKIVVELEAVTATARVIVPPKPARAEMQVKPDPLTLIIAADKNGNVTLNQDPMGKLADLSHLTKVLYDVYHEREENGVFRPDTNDVEKTVLIKMPLDATGADLTKVLKALDDAGADRILLQIDDMTDRRKGLMDVPLAPPKPGK